MYETVDLDSVPTSRLRVEAIRGGYPDKGLYDDVRPNKQRSEGLHQYSKVDLTKKKKIVYQQVINE